MKKFVSQIAFYGLPILVFLVWVWFKPLDQNKSWDRINDNCPKASCLIKLIQQDNPIDAVFIGSSRTMNAINDTTLIKKTGLNVVNLGYCRHGRNLQLHILQEVFKHHTPKRVFIEVGIDEDWYGHLDFANIVSTSNVLKSITYKNPKYLRDIKYSFVAHYDLFQRDVLFNPYYSHTCDYGYMGRTDTNSLTPKDLPKPNTKNQRYTSEKYLEQMLNLCSKNKAKVIFTYLPAFGRHSFEPHYKEYYEAKGVLLSGLSVLNDKKYWSDNSHLNIEGSKVYTDYLLYTDALKFK